MSGEKKSKLWQNLLDGRCPVCGKKLVVLGKKERGYECSGEECQFIISKAKLIAILSDKSHILRSFVPEGRLSEIDSLVKKLIAEERDAMRADKEHAIV